MFAEAILHAPDHSEESVNVSFSQQSDSSGATHFMEDTHLNLSIQSIPLGSSFEYTKQLNASRNCSPHGPCAMPPRQGQSQFISPVSSLKAPCCPASSSYSSGVLGVSSVFGDGGSAGDVVSTGVFGSMDGMAESFVDNGTGSGDELFARRVEDMESRVGREESSVEESGSWAVETVSAISTGLSRSEQLARTRWLFSKDIACIVVINSSYN